MLCNKRTKFYLCTRFVDVSITLVAVLPSFLALVLVVSRSLCRPDGDFRLRTKPFLANLRSNSTLTFAWRFAALNATLISLVLKIGNNKILDQHPQYKAIQILTFTLLSFYLDWRNGNFWRFGWC